MKQLPLKYKRNILIISRNNNEIKCDCIKAGQSRWNYISESNKILGNFDNFTGPRANPVIKYALYDAESHLRN